MKPRNRHVTHENRSNGPKVVETDARSPMLPMYSAAELAVRDPRRLSCVYEAACVKELEHNLAESEVEWLREREAEAEDKPTSPEAPAAKKKAATKKAAPKKATAKKAAPKKATAKKAK
jgi:hypothetical protein